MNRIQYILVFFFIPIAIFGQSINVFDVKTTSYPNSQASFYAITENGNLISNLTVDDFTITENGEVLEVLNVSCQPSTTPPRISAILSVDISTSMAGRNIELAEAAAEEWINLINLNLNECAVTTFNHYNYFNQDFTQDKNKLLNSLNNISPSGGTNFDVALLDSMAGALLVAEKAKYQPVIVMITDGNSSGNITEIVDKAKEMNAKIYSVILGHEVPEILTSIASYTGGRCFGNITSEEEIRKVYRVILYLSQDFDPCILTWKNGSCSIERDLSVEIPSLELSDSLSYKVSTGFLPLIYYPLSSHIDFETVQADEEKTMEIILQAKNKSISVGKVESDDPRFEIKNPNGSFIIEQNMPQAIEVKYTASDTLYTFAHFKITSDACIGNEFTASAGSKDKVEQNTLNLTKPIGGEYFNVNSDTLISWEGINPLDTVLIEFSSNGIDYQKVTDKANLLKYEWKIPNSPSSDCKVRIKRLTTGPDYSKIIKLPLQGGKINSIKFSPDGTKLLVGSDDGSINIWNPKTGELIKNITNDDFSIISLDWSPDGKYIVRGGFYNDIRIWDSETGEIFADFQGAGARYPIVAWRPDGEKIAAGASNGDIIIWDFTSQQVDTTYKANPERITDIAWEENSRLLASSDESGQLILSDFESEPIYKLIFDYDLRLNSIEWTQGGESILAAANYPEIMQWNIADNGLLRSIAIPKPNAKNLCIQGGEDKILYVENDSLPVVYDMIGDTVYYEYKGHVGIVSAADWSSDNIYIATGSQAGNVHIWSINDVPFERGVVQEDSSNFFTIIDPVLQIKPIDFGSRIILKSVDSLVTGFIYNPGNTSIKVDSIAIRSGDFAKFEILSDHKDIIIQPDESKSFEFSYYPDEYGENSSTVYVYFHDKVQQTDIQGFGVVADIDLINDIIDFKQVNIEDSLKIEVNALLNSGPGKVSIDSVRLTGPDNSQFRYSGNDSFIIEASGGVAMIRTAFLPVQLGRTSGSISFYYNGPGSPAVVRLFGEGVAPEMQTDSDSLWLGKLICEDESELFSQKIYNSGEGILKIQNITIDGDSEDFSFDEDIIGSEIENNGETELKIRFVPNSFGLKEAIVTIETNITKSGQTSNSFKINGYKDISDFKLSRNLIEFSDLNPDESQEKEIYIKNIGTVPVSFDFPATIGKFEIISITPDIILPDDSALVIVRFNGASEGEVFNESFYFEDDCGNTRKLSLSAIVGQNDAVIEINESFEFPLIVCENEIEGSINIVNSGSTPLIISDVEINSEHFSLTIDINVIEIAPGNSQKLSILFFAEQAGEYLADLIITSNAKNSVNNISTVYLSGSKKVSDFSFDTDTLDFGRVRLGISAEASFLILNTGTLPISWQLPDKVGPFIISQPSPTRTIPNGSSIVDVEFGGINMENDYIESLIISDSCGNNKEIVFRISVEGRPEAGIKVGLAEAEPGEEFTIPIYLLNAGSPELDKVSGYNATIDYNATLFVPAGNTPHGEIINGRRYIELTNLPANPIDGDAIARLKFIATLGDTTETRINIRNSSALGDDMIQMEEIPGFFSLKNICEAGGIRLIGNTGIFNLQQNRPNPANEKTIIEFFAIEEGHHKLVIYDITGRLVDIAFDKSISAGPVTVEINTKKNSIGTYFYVLYTPSSRYIRKMNIIR